MRKWLTQAIVVLSIWLACCSPAIALDPALDINQYAHSSWRVRDGFAKGFIYAIAQTPDGYLWLGTEYGLFRFDGVRAVPWRAANGKLPSNEIPTLLVTRDGMLWVGTRRGLASVRDGKLTTYSELNGSEISVLLEDSNGTLWAATHEPRLAGQTVGVIEADRGGNYWVAFDKNSRKWKTSQPELPEVQNLLLSQSAVNDVESLSPSGQVHLPNAVLARLERAASTGSSQHYNKMPQILRDRDGALWIATPGRGLAHVHNGKTDVFSETDGLSGNTVTGLLEDQEGDVWAVTSNGIDKFREYAVPNISFKQGLSNANTVAIIAARDGSVWVATDNGLNRWKDGHFTLANAIRHTQDLDRTLAAAPYSLFQDRAGRIWISTAREFGYLEGSHFIPMHQIHGGRITSVTEGSSGDLWLAKAEAGLLHFSNGRVIARFPWTALGHEDDGRVVLTDPSKRGIWIGFSSGGVSYFSDGAIRKSYSVADGLGAGGVNNLRFGPRGALWVATENGLSRIKNDHVKTMTSKNGLPCDRIHWTVDDANHFIWVYTACGLVRISRTEMDAWTDDPSRIVATTLFDVSDGVRIHLNNPAVQGVSMAPDGKIWYVALDGVSVIDPQHFPFNKISPPVHIEQVTADNATYDAKDGLRLPARVRNLVIDYTALSLVDPTKMHFRYKLENQDSDWREVVNDRQVQYSNLPPGNYHFRVKASNNSGVWNEQGASFNFVIPPMWYQTNWFRLVFVACVLIFVWAGYKIRVRQLAYQFDLSLEARVAERTRIARDLHDTLLQTFQAQLLRFHTAMYKLPEDALDARKTLEEAVEQASEAIAEGRNAVQGLRTSTLEKTELAGAIRTLAEELAAAEAGQSSSDFKVVVEGAARDLHPIMRDEVYRLVAEALRNAFRHAAAQNVEVEIRYDKKYFRLRIRDDGKGIDEEFLRPEGRRGHFGLHGMAERADIVGGKLAIWSKVDRGTEIEIVIPGSKAYEKPTRSFWRAGRRSANEADGGKG